MKNTNYFKMALGFLFGSLLYAFLTLCFGNFYPFVKSLFTDADSSVLFNEAASKTNLLNVFSKAIFVSSFITIWKYFSEKKASKKTNE